MLTATQVLTTFCFAGLGLIVGLASTAANCSAAPPISSEADDFFEKRIRPVLVSKCYECHSAEATELQGGLMLDNRAAIEKGGDSGKTVVPGDPDASRLIVAIRYHDDALQMPPDGKLADDVIADFIRWVRMGAPDPRDGPAPLRLDSIEARAQQHWAFQQPRKPELPVVRNRSWPVMKIDHFILARLEEADIEPSGRADARTLMRRLYYDLIGLPPTFDEVQSFASDSSPDAYARLVDRLLESQHFGERWARHWLDVARFGDTKGYVFTADRNYPHAHKYRDWVINALNHDMPYDEFLKYQLAADHLVTADDRRHLSAMGFLTLGRRFLNDTHDLIDDRIDVVFRGTMGLTLGCARCHDHKYDPLSMHDYYGTYGVFSSSREQQDAELPLHLVDKDHPVDVHVFLRGSASNRGDLAKRQFLRFFSDVKAKSFEQGSGRLELAEAITSSKNPLTARVFVNRVWGHLFGEGLVRTPSDFGLRSGSPIHQDVLDYLAFSFVEDEWSIKHLVRRIVLSGAYRQQSDLRAELQERDPDNLLLWRANRRRLDFEAMRDSLLAVSGRLDRTVLGASVRIDTATPSNRRTLYAFIDRQNLPGLFRTFDFASPDTHSPKRPNTTVPQQALYLMNNSSVQAIAEELVSRLNDVKDTEARIRSLFSLVYGREVTANELAIAKDFLEPASEAEVGGSTNSPWQFGHGKFSKVSAGATSFHALPHFTGDAWQGAAGLPDPQLGWVILNARGGHAGNDQDHAAIRRWIAPLSGEITVSGRLEHPSENGDGIRGRIVSSRDGLLGEWTAQHQTVDTKTDLVEIKAGDTIDFLADCRSNVNHDSFHWTVTIKMVQPMRSEWKSDRGFHGPVPNPLGPWARFAQTLLLTNEFMFVD